MTTVSLISGKGGSGKTSVALSLAQVLAILDYRVLLVDLDTATHGASYFFETRKPGLEEWVLANPYAVMKPTQSDQKAPEFGIEGLISEVGTHPSFSFIASKTQFQTSDWETDYVAANATILASGLERIISNREFDFVLFDCQAGVNVVTAKALELSEYAVIVTEADSVSTRALRSLQNQFSHVLPRNTKALINKLFLQEKATYDQLISILRNLEFLPPIPFDMDVRDAFARNVIPLQTDKPTPYFSSILRVLGELVPSTASRIEKKTAELEDVEFGNYEQELAKLERQREYLNRKRQDSIREIEREKESNERFRRLLIPMLLIVASFVPFFYEKFSNKISSTLLIAFFGITVAYAWIVNEIFLRSRKRRVLDREQKIDEMSEEIKVLNERIERYSTLYLTERKKVLF